MNFYYVLFFWAHSTDEIRLSVDITRILFTYCATIFQRVCVRHMISCKLRRAENIEWRHVVKGCRNQNLWTWLPKISLPGPRIPEPPAISRSNDPRPYAAVSAHSGNDAARARRKSVRVVLRCLHLFYFGSLVLISGAAQPGGYRSNECSNGRDFFIQLV
jgi:hypothetical protein